LSIGKWFISSRETLSLRRMVIAPALFISHGAPTFALDPGALGPQLAVLGERFANIRGILILSPHWQTKGITVMATERPTTVHDFGGFPEVLYALQYPATGSPRLAAQAAALLEKAGLPVRLDDERGLDHGAWIPLRYLRPKADVPVVQVSLPHDLNPGGALRLGAALRSLRGQGVVIVGSGSLTHNLYEFRHAFATPETYAVEFASWIGAQLRAGNLEALVEYRSQAPHAARAHPTEEHYLPLLVALGARLENDELQVLQGGIAHGVLAMDSYVFSQGAGDERDRA
jgi:4,5-DOPA dioxygenase extradiol